MKIAAYCRVSTDSKQQLNSLENQKTFFESYAEREGHTLYRIYADRGISGKALKNRTEFLQMIEDSKTKKFELLVVKDISRFARNTVDFLSGIRKLKANGINVRFLSCNMNTLGESEFALTMFAAIAQEESYNLSKKIMFGKKVSAQKGRTPPLVYGYEKKDTYTLKIDAKEAVVVKKIFSLYASGEWGVRKIAKYLNEEKIPAKKSQKWEAKTIRRMLSNPIYKGVLVNNKSETVDFMESTRKILPAKENYIHKLPHLKIISPAMFNRVQQILKEKSAKSCHKQKL